MKYKYRLTFEHKLLYGITVKAYTLLMSLDQLDHVLDYHVRTHGAKLLRVSRLDRRRGQR